MTSKLFDNAMAGNAQEAAEEKFRGLLEAAPDAKVELKLEPVVCQSVVEGVNFRW